MGLIFAWSQALTALFLLLVAFLGLQAYIALQVIRNKRNEPLILNRTQKFYLHQWALKKFGKIHTRKD
ncbi:hypothetical protein EV05_1980 [Prochlorococcus sp. MIT 0601]|nr:hypothetical protein EV05_1980 [Prochlorococcus sp. MIT 0601]